ncbi:MAG: hypothetical protein EOM55_00860 [Clostridia bacterium]|nr:hypothetical protein [Clostridia bacterium]
MNKSNKTYLLTHILYEIDNYLYSYQNQIKLLSKQKTENWQNEYNSAWVTHRVSLRNLIEFFCWRNNSYFEKKEEREKDKTNVFYQYFSCAKKIKELKSKDINVGKLRSYINQSISHITEKRFKENTIDEYLANKTDIIFIKLANIIKQFLIDILNNKENVKYMNPLTLETRPLFEEINYYENKIKSILTFVSIYAVKGSWINLK